MVASWAVARIAVPQTRFIHEELKSQHERQGNSEDQELKRVDLGSEDHEVFDFKSLWISDGLIGDPEEHRILQ